MIRQLFEFSHDKIISEYARVLYKWDSDKKQVISDYIYLDSKSYHTNSRFVLGINSHAVNCNYNNEISSIMSFSKIAVDKTNNIGEKYLTLIKDIYPYEFTIINCCDGIIKLYCPIIKTFNIDQYNEITTKNAIVKLEKLYGYDRLTFILDFRPFYNTIPSDDKYMDGQIIFDYTIKCIYDYLRLYAKTFSKSALMCPKCYKSFHKMEMRHIPIFYNISVFDIEGTHECPYCKYKGTDFAIIDENMVKIIYYLNHRGVKTIACCSGHSWNDYDIYVMFNDEEFKRAASINTKSGKYNIDEQQIKEVFGDQFDFEYYPDQNAIVCRFKYDLDYRFENNFEAEFDDFDQFSKHICYNMLEMFKWILNGYKMKESPEG